MVTCFGPLFFYSLATNCHSLLDTRALSEHDKNWSFDEELSVLGETLFFVHLVAQVQYHHKKEGLILLSQYIKVKETVAFTLQIL